MGKLNLSIIKGKLNAIKKRKFFGGDANKVKGRIESMKNNGVPYTKINSGGVVIIHDSSKGETIYLQTTKRSIEEEKNFNNLTEKQKEKVRKTERMELSDIMNCCKDVLKCVREFEKKNGKLESRPANPQGVMELNIINHIGNGETEVSLVDVNHCYWRMAFISGIITEAVYEKWKDKKLPRLKAMGNLKKVSTVETFDGTDVTTENVKNKHAWAWDYLVYRTFCLMMEIKKACGNNIFAYHTDGIYMPSENVSVAKEIIEAHNLNCKVVEYNIYGYNGVSFVLEDKKTKELKRANLGSVRGLHDVLKPVTNVEIEESKPKPTAKPKKNGRK